MAAGDMLMKLLLNTKDFDGKIGKSKKEVQSLGKTSNEISDAIAGAFGKIGAAFLTLDTAKKFFDDFIASSQHNTDEFGRITLQTKAFWEDFVDSFTDSSINSAFDGILTRAKDLYDAMDALANVQLSTNFTSTLESARFKENVVIARNKSLPFEDRYAALEEASASAQEIYEAGQVNKQAAEEAVRRKLSLASGVPASMISINDVEKILKTDSRLTRPQERSNIVSKKRAYDERLKEIDLLYGDVYSGVWGTLIDNSAKRKDMKQNAMSQYSGWLLQYAALFKLTDDELKELADTYTTYTQALERSSELLGQTNEIYASIKNEEKAAAEAAAKRAAELQEIDRLKKEVYGARKVDHNGPGGEFIIPTALNKASKVQDLDIPNVWDSVLMDEATERAKEFETVSTSVDMLSSSFSRLGGAIGGSAGEMLSFVGSVAEAAGAIIPLIANIYAEKMAHEANANAATTEAAAKTLSAYAGIPFAGLALGAAAVAGIISVLSSLPKFAEGGIATSATLGVFGEAGPEAIMPLDRLNDFIAPREVRVTGKIVGRGKNLVVAIDNYNKIQKVK